MVEADHAVARFELGDALTDFYYRSGKLVAENLRRLDKAVVNFFDVGAADAACGHSEEEFAFANFGNRHRLNGYTAFAAVDSGAHLAIG
jgi:hypothetical protein